MMGNVRELHLIISRLVGTLEGVRQSGRLPEKSNRNIDEQVRDGCRAIGVDVNDVRAEITRRMAKDTTGEANKTNQSIALQNKLDELAKGITGDA